VTDDYWGPMPDDSEYPTPRERLDDGEAERLRALLRRWVDGNCRIAPHRDRRLIADTLKELGK